MTAHIHVTTYVHIHTHPHTNMCECIHSHLHALFGALAHESIRANYLHIVMHASSLGCQISISLVNLLMASHTQSHVMISRHSSQPVLCSEICAFMNGAALLAFPFHSIPAPKQCAWLGVHITCVLGLASISRPYHVHLSGCSFTVQCCVLPTVSLDSFIPHLGFLPHVLNLHLF